MTPIDKDQRRDQLGDQRWGSPDNGTCSGKKQIYGVGRGGEERCLLTEITGCYRSARNV
jgi:hypothetical protein